MIDESIVKDALRYRVIRDIAKELRYLPDHNGDMCFELRDEFGASICPVHAHQTLDETIDYIISEFKL